MAGDAWRCLHGETHELGRGCSGTIGNDDVMFWKVLERARIMEMLGTGLRTISGS